jgi:ATPase subunit of ABC transporter with duplicated ATPase domains
LHNIAVECEGITKEYDRTIFKNFNLAIQPGEKIAIIGQNGAGKTTLLNTILSERFNGHATDHGKVRWAENADVGIMPQDTNESFPKDMNLSDWMGLWAKPGDDDQAIRSILGRLLFSGPEITKSVKVISGGEKGRMIWGKLMLGRHNVLALDEPTNHMDMESIESMQIALEKFKGTLIFVSHDREFVSGLANRILEVQMDGTINDFSGSYEEYLTNQGLEN